MPVVGRSSSLPAGERHAVHRPKAMFLLFFIFVWIPAPSDGYYTPSSSNNAHKIRSKLLQSSAIYDETNAGVKGIVSGLTALTNALFLKGDVATVRTYVKQSVSPPDVLNGVIGDFENGYLFSGAIDSQIYAEDCVFTDPTLSFQGLTTFETNIRNLKPVLEKLVGDTVVVLYNATLDQSTSKVYTQWRMSGMVRLPWRPKIELTGNTELTYDELNNNGRIVSYFERWDLDAGKALFQLLQPARLIPSPSFPPPTSISSTSSSGSSSTSTGSSSSAITINVAKLKARVLDAVRRNDRDCLAAARQTVSLLMRAAPLETLRAIQAVGDVSAGMKQATTAAYARLSANKWKVVCATQRAAGVIGNSGAVVTISAEGSVVSETINIVLGQSVQSEYSSTDRQTLHWRRLSSGDRLMGIPFRQQRPPGDHSGVEYSLGFYDDEWMVFVDEGLGDFFILSTKL